MKQTSFYAFLLIAFVLSCSPKLVVTPLKTEEVPLIEQPPEANKNMEPADEFAAGKSLFENKCAQCHDLYHPTDFTKEQWRPILASMQIKAKLDDQQMENIYNYIVAASK